MESSQNKLSLTVKKTYKDMLSITKKEDKFYYLEIKKKYYKISEIKTIGMILLLISDIQNIFNSYNDNTNNSFDFISPYNVSLYEETNQDFLKIIHDPKYKDIKEVIDKIKFNIHDKNVSRKEFSNEVIKQINSKEKRGEDA